jgi:DNA-binding IclR family transcriptional regulator
VTRDADRDAYVLRELKQMQRSRPGGVLAATLAGRVGLPTASVSAALGRLEDAGLASPVASSGMPRGANGPRVWRAL